MKEKLINTKTKIEKKILEIEKQELEEKIGAKNLDVIRYKTQYDGVIIGIFRIIVKHNTMKIYPVIYPIRNNSLIMQYRLIYNIEKIKRYKTDQKLKDLLIKNN